MKKEQQKRINKLMDRLIAKPGKKISLKDYDPDWTGTIKDKKEADPSPRGWRQAAREAAGPLYAQDTYSLLMVFQAMDAAGKDGTIRHVMSGINPQGCQVFSFKAPSAEERDHDYLWRSHEGAARARPDRHPQPLVLRGSAGRPRPSRDPRVAAAARRPQEGKGIWKRRFEQINNFERYLRRQRHASS